MFNYLSIDAPRTFESVVGRDSFAPKKAAVWDIRADRRGGNEQEINRTYA
jgi:hypothetical protein